LRSNGAYRATRLRMRSGYGLPRNMEIVELFEIPPRPQRTIRPSGRDTRASGLRWRRERELSGCSGRTSRLTALPDGIAHPAHEESASA
jgi:hypothetical protein